MKGEIMKDRKKAFLLFSVLVLCLSSRVCRAEDFSADLATANQDKAVEGKIFVTQSKTRMEMGETVIITRVDKKVAWVLIPEQKMYMEQPLNPRDVIGSTMDMPGEVERKLLGPDTVDGKSVDKYRVVYAEQGKNSVVYQWIDPRLKIPIKTVAEDGSWSMEYKNINTGAQPDSLFELPEGYQKFSATMPSGSGPGGE